MKILVINCGSSSIKFQFINTKIKEVLAQGIIEKIGEETSSFTFKSKKLNKNKTEITVKNHALGIWLIIDNLMNRENGVIKSEQDIDAIGHRLVHGGEEFSGSVIIDDNVLASMRKCIKMAPLHNPHNIRGVEACKKNLPEVPQCGVFDTAFHQTMPEKAFLYALPLKFYTKHKIRRYGFHGTSHKYVSQLAADYLKEDNKKLKIITCHIGNGASITAVEGGKSIDTSMGFTPLEGLVMGTRCGDIDPAIPTFILKEMNLDADMVNAILNRKSGILGLSNISNDMRIIEDEVLINKNPDAIRALDVYAYRIKKYIGAYATVMNGLDVMVFTGGVGENMPILRELVCKDMDYLGIELDEKENNQFVKGILDLSTKDSKVKVLKIPTNEELMIALETERLLAI
ncbi:MAG: acetate kinase [Armatimonadetes bacterium]|nr:acetate kinase [Armatimonadota bacterium]